MKTTRPELGIERVLVALERDLLDATDEEISAVASELGIKPGMKGSIALFGVTRAVRLNQGDNSTKHSSATKERGSKTGSRRRPKGDIPSSR
ncbi:MAG TPA: hypothetical protein VHY19_05005 [Steroidobacteraceae bacterium]|jgi:hypothetical protein|nr:hypothetical protein [Steroidobacteraceae bacterium]